MSVTQILDALKTKIPSICVIGDIILDQYIWTTVSRISPEAPVPVCSVNHTSFVLGGATNVANNIRSFGGDCSLAGIIGTDQYGQKMLGLLDENGINHDLIIQTSDVNTICKSRVIARNQQLCRLDYEDKPLNFEKQSRQLNQQLMDKLSSFDVIVLSDYNKGTITDSLSQDVIAIANQHQIPVIVDPKGYNVSKYKGATVITPNMSEFREMTMLNGNVDDNELRASGMDIITKQSIDSILLTRSEKGVRLMTASECIDFPTKVKDVVDVTGAGDTVVAAVAFSIALHLDQVAMAEFLNLAAGVVVSKVGTATATLDEIQAHEARL